MLFSSLDNSQVVAEEEDIPLGRSDGASRNSNAINDGIEVKSLGIEDAQSKNTIKSQISVSKNDGHVIPVISNC